MPIPIILDCDPGHDDALAILLALARPELRVLGITTVAGNASLDATTRNALRILTLLARTDVPVAAGASRPLLQEPHAAPEVHGTSGLDGADLPEPSADPRPEGAIELIASLVRASGVPVTLVPTGPLTNIALFLRTHPGLADRIERICLMGGSMGVGNTTASAEFNIWCDPEAAAMVFQSGRPIAMHGLDVTHQALFTSADIDRLAGIGSRTAGIFADLLRFYARFHSEHYAWDGAPIHDAVAVGHVAVPGLVETRPYRVDVVTGDGVARGRTVVDVEGQTGLPANAEVGVAIDRERFIRLLLDAVRAHPGVDSPPA
jgi:pyrimidine-specific ribonucleoside hydrolase